MAKLKISICIPVFNSENTIAKLVQKIQDDLHKYTLEIVLVSDGSSDSSEEICIDLLKFSEVVLKYFPFNSSLFAKAIA